MKNIPDIDNIEDFEEQWVEWWSVCQPEWRDTDCWPFPQEDTVGCDWGDLPDGGKDGLFLVMVSLGWWIYARDPAEDSRVDDIISDVTWVIDGLVSLLTTETSSLHSSPDPPPVPPPAPRRQRSRTGPDLPPTTQRKKRSHSNVDSPSPAPQKKRSRTRPDPPRAPSPTPKKKCSRSLKIGPPKRAKRAHR